MILKQLKYFFLFLLTLLLGAQTTYAKTELVLPQNKISFSIEQTQRFNNIEKEVPPNIGFLKEKVRFVVSEGVSAQNTYDFSEIDVSNLVKGESDILWTHIDEFDSFFQGSPATFYDIIVTYQSARPEVGVSLLNDVGQLELHLNIPEVLQRQGLGSAIFRKALDDWAPIEVKGWWKESDIYTGGESINLTIFKENLAKNMSIQDAARQTPSGKIFGLEGFTEVNVLTNESNEVIVIFTRP